MKYLEMIKSVQEHSGFSNTEAESSVHSFIRTLARRLTPDERKDFASQLPSELHDTALQTNEIEKKSMDDMIIDVAEEQHIDESRAKKQIMAAWQMLKEALTPGQIDHIRAQMPKDMTAQLH